MVRICRRSLREGDRCFPVGSVRQQNHSVTKKETGLMLRGFLSRFLRAFRGALLWNLGALFTCF